MLRRQMLTTLAVVGLFFLVPAESLYALAAAECAAFDDPDDRAECENEQEQQQEDDDDTLDQMEREALAEAVDNAIDAVVNAADTVMGAVGTVVSAVANVVETVAEPVCKLVVTYQETIVEECWPEAGAVVATCGAALGGMVTVQPWVAFPGAVGCAATDGMLTRCIEKVVVEEHKEKVCED